MLDNDLLKLSVSKVVAKTKKVSFSVVSSDPEINFDCGCDIDLPDTFPTLTLEMVHLIVIGGILNFVGLCSPKVVKLPELELTTSAKKAITRLYQIVSDARQLAVSKDLELLKKNLLSLEFRNGNKFAKNKNNLNPKKVIQLCSGGIDSFLSILEFQKKGFEIELLHVTGINVDNADSERNASQAIAQLLKLRLHEVKVNWHGIRRFGIKYNLGKYSSWPEANAVPFGRDLLLSILASVLCIQENAATIGIANDYESWERESVKIDREKYPETCRNELASKMAHPFLVQFLKSVFNQQINIVSPIIGLSKYAIVDRVATQYPTFIHRLSSCFWGGWCGACHKCMTYGLFLAQYPEVIVDFETNPLNSSNANILSHEEIQNIVNMCQEFVNDKR